MAFLQSRLEGRGKGKLGINRSTPGSPPGALGPRFTISIDAGGGRLGPLLSGCGCWQDVGMGVEHEHVHL